MCETISRQGTVTPSCLVMSQRVEEVTASCREIVPHITTHTTTYYFYAFFVQIKQVRDDVLNRLILFPLDRARLAISSLYAKLN